MGSKARFSKDILEITLKNRADGQYYVEPFAGGMNVMELVRGNRLANDNNKYLIEMWRQLVRGKIYPEEIDKNLYDIARDVFRGREVRPEHLKNMTYDFIGWIGFMGSANGRFFEGGYSGKSVTKTGKTRDYVDESIRNIKKQIDSLSGVLFTCGCYREMDIPKKSIIYCDIPYYGTKQYSTSKNFCHKDFWTWARSMGELGHEVFVSEYSGERDFEEVWSKETTSSLSANAEGGGNKKSVEKLFKYKAKGLDRTQKPTSFLREEPLSFFNDEMLLASDD